jgi:hypothetical protein
MSEWIAKDGEFQLDQERSRAAIRIREKRAKAIDFLALNLKYAHPLDEDHVEDDAGLEIDLDEPYHILDVRMQDFERRVMQLTSPQNLSPDQIDELHDDIECYLSLETSEVDIDFWTVC